MSTERTLTCLLALGPKFLYRVADDNDDAIYANFIVFTITLPTFFFRVPVPVSMLPRDARKRFFLPLFPQSFSHSPESDKKRSKINYFILSTFYFFSTFVCMPCTEKPWKILYNFLENFFNEKRNVTMQTPTEFR